MAELVECRSDAGYAERPTALTWEGRRLEISQVKAEWRTPDAKYFQVRTADGQEFELTYRSATDDWQIQQI